MEFEPLDQYQQRRKKLGQIRSLGWDPYPHEFRWKQTPAELVARYSATSGSELEAARVEVALAGRIATLRLHGKAGFAHLQGGGGRIQAYLKLDVVG